jgi:hypothetical protein
MNSFAYAQENIVHIVQKGETVSDILFNRNIGPIYGKKGALKAILKLNPHITTREDGKVYPGDVVLIKHRSLQFSFITKEESPGNEGLQKVELQEQISFTRDESARSTASKAQVQSESVIEDNFEQSSYWSLVPSIYWQTLDAVHENIYRRSELHSYSTNNYALSFLYGKHFKRDIDLYSRASLNFSFFEMGEDEQVVSKKYTTSSFYVGAELYKKYQLELGMEEKLYLVSSNYANADIKKIKVPKISVGYSTDFYKYEAATFSGEFSAKSFLPKKSAALKTKTGYGASGEVKMKFSNQAVSVGLEKDFLKAQGNTTDSQTLFLKFTWDMQ